jgi:CBS domain containing-hemolysin-like protein
MDGGEAKAHEVLACQEQPGMFFTTVQIGINAVGILGGVVGDSLLSPHIAATFPAFVSPTVAGSVASVLSVLLLTVLFVLFSDVVPKRIAMASPEKVAMKLISPMKKCITVLSPMSRAFNSVSNSIFRVIGMIDNRRDDITSDDLYAVMEAGAMAGLLRKQEKELIGNVFELESRAVTSAMTTRENIVYFDINDGEESIKDKVADQPHSTYIVCNGGIDRVVGYVDSKQLLELTLKGQHLDLKNTLHIRAPLILPDTLTLAEAMDQFKGKEEDLAVVLNEYALVVGILSLKDIMTMLMGNLVGEEEQIMKRDDNSWLIEGATPINDVMSVMQIDEFPNSDNYETIGGFLTYRLRRIPNRTDFVNFGGYRFEVMDIDNYKIDQILVVRIDEKPNTRTDDKAVEGSE